MAKHSIEKTRRQYNRWVATETIEDYALRYSPASFRKWSPLLIANTALGSISFLALEAIGASLLLSYGYTNAVWAILFASIVIFGAGLPISYYAARYNIDIDLLTRSAGFGYVGSTITSLIYASFCFIFFALEAAIMAQALDLYFELPLYLGYILCSLIIIPIVFYGITAINRLHLWTQPVWLILMLLPFYILYTQAPHTIEALSQFSGQVSGGSEFDPYYFGIATGISFSLIAQIGEQVDYLRFMPDKHKDNRLSWWISMLAAGPGWIVLGCLKQLAGALLASIAILAGLAYAEAKEPVQMYYIAYIYVFDHPGLAIFVSTVFVVTSQIKINVTNAYAGSLAWSNFFSRVTHAHPGRVVWLVFNIGIALLLMEMGVFEALQKVLGLYSNVAIAWIFAVVSDLTINKVLKLSPPIVEFKRAHLYNYNPVGFVSMSVASLVSISAFTGVFGLYAQAYSWLIAMTISFMLVPIIAKLTKGKYYIARPNLHFKNSDQVCTCGVCDQHYSQTDFAYCPYYDFSICSLCCTLDSGCKDQCKPSQISFYRQAVANLLAFVFKHKVSKQTAFRIAQFILISGVMLVVVAITFWTSYSLNYDNTDAKKASENAIALFNLFFVLVGLISIAAWWIVLVQESQALAESELHEQNETLEQEIIIRKQTEKYEYFRSHALEMLAGNNSLSTILEAIVRGVEQLNPGMLCSILLVDCDGKHLVKGIAPSLPDFYNAAINGIEIGSGVGSCGTSALTGKRVIVTDIQTHPYWASFKELAASAGLGACWSQPIRSSSGLVLGTFAIYHHSAHTPLESDIYLIEQSAHLASIAIDRKQAEEEISNLAFYDVLTKLPNRRLLMDRLHLALSVSARNNYYGALLFLDMDKFKIINDMLGHDYGDLLLIEVSNRIRSCVREMDTVARFGGDEFVVLLEEVDENVEVASQKTALIAEKIRALLSMPYQLNGNEQDSSPSIGVCLYRGKNESTETLIKQADMAMYQAKDSGRNTVRFFDPVMQQAAQIHSLLEADLRHAVPDQQLHLYYQIQVDNDLSPIGAEALVRWLHPRHGMVSPMQFIPIAEESSLILDIGHWVLDTACRQLAVWANFELTKQLTLAVNVSAQQFKQYDFVENIAAILSLYEVPALRLKLELTESVVLSDLIDVVSKMHALQALGVSLSMDDFGTGYSSLSYLKQLPLDQIKIDQSFVRDITTDPNDAVMVQTIINLAQNFRLNVIAEGVETEAQFKFLKEHGCMAYQGYFFSKPVTIEQFEQLLVSSGCGQLSSPLKD